MNWKRYMKNRMPAMLINLAGMVALALFLLASGSSIDTVVFIVVIWLLVFVIYMVVSCYGRKRYLDKLLDITDQLEEAYLIADLMKEPERADDEVFYQILKLAEKSMLENISAVMQERRDYRDYIEQWVHEVKTPITAMKLLCENHPSEFSRAILTELEKVDRFTEQTLYYARSEHTQKDYAIREIQLSDASDGFIAQENMTINNAETDILYADISCGTVPNNSSIALYLVQGDVVKSFDVTNLSGTLEYSLDEFENGEIHVRLLIEGVEDTISKIYIK